MLELVESKNVYIKNIKNKMAKSEQKTRTIAITSGKGGVGKTHTTVNLGLHLAQLGNKVLLLDGDLGLANINILLGFKPKKNLQQVITGEASLEDVIVEALPNLDIIPAASGIPELVSLSETERVSLLDGFEHLSKNYDYMLVDTAAGIGDNVLYFNNAVEDILVVIGPEPTSITDAYALIKVLSTRCNRKEFHILVNRVENLTAAKNTFQQFTNVTEQFLNVSLKLTGYISEDSSVSQAVLKQQPYSLLYPSCKASVDMRRIAQKIQAMEKKTQDQGGLQFFFRNLMNA